MPTKVKVALEITTPAVNAKVEQLALWPENESAMTETAKEQAQKRQQKTKQHIQKQRQKKKTELGNSHKQAENEHLLRAFTKLLFYATKIAYQQGHLTRMVVLNLAKCQLEQDPKNKVLFEQTVLNYQNHQPAIVLKYQTDGYLSATIWNTSQTKRKIVMTVTRQLLNAQQEPLTKKELLETLRQQATNEVLCFHWPLKQLEH